MNPIVSNGNKLRWTFLNVNNISNEHLSDIFTIANLDWEISVRENQYNLEINLCCDTDTDNDNKNWICEVNAKVKLIKQDGSKPDIQKDLKECFHQERYRCGIEEFTSWNILNDYRNYCYEIIVEVDLNFKFYDFSKTIPNFTDIVVYVEDTEFHLNKWVLSSKSEYFYDFFVNKKVENTKIQLKSEKAVDFCYMLASFTHGFNTNLDVKYPELIRLAKKLGVQSLHYACEQYLVSLTNLKAIDGIRIADENGYENLMDKMIESLKTPEDIRRIKVDDKFAQLEKTTQLRIMFRFFDCV